jgi:hypothetical protein
VSRKQICRNAGNREDRHHCQKFAPERSSGPAMGCCQIKPKQKLSGASRDGQIGMTGVSRYENMSTPRR